MSLTSHQPPGHRGITDVWLTPPEIIEALGPFDVDPCAAVDQPWPTAAIQWTDRGLDREWKGLAWMNPPFSEAESWFRHLADHGHGIGLTAARTETRWFVKHVWRRADGILFLHGRPHFHHPNGIRGKDNSGAPICLIAYGSVAVERLRASGLAGTLVSGWR